jgi:Heterokaryon incompatibility protein (HET)
MTNTIAFPAGVARKPAQLCEKCQPIFHQPLNFNERDDARWFEHHEDLVSLQSSADRGCSLCAQFLRGFQNFFSDDYVAKTGRVLLHSSWPEGCMMLNLTVRRRSTVPGKLTHRVWLRPTLNQGTSPIDSICMVGLKDLTLTAVDYDAPNLNISTADALPLCKLWLSECLGTHQTCHAPLTPAMLPTRLIDAGDKGPRLCLSGDIESDACYVALSHCWGSLDFLTLRKNNIDIFRKQIPNLALTKTFRDAIYITQYLGFRYVWIDSLCIVQDDKADWAQEADLMTGVYGGSTVTIAASSATDGSVGCFFNRPKTWRCQIHTGRDAGQILYDGVIEHSTTRLNIPLHSRAWAVQERYLSRRILHFYENEVFWECLWCCRCETFPNESIDRVHSNAFELSPKRITRLQWPHIINHYSQRKLTRSSDKLVAIGGLARLVHETSKDEYLGGMWRKNLEMQLCWTSGVQNQSKSETYTAPTWSWASSNAHVIPAEEDDGREEPDHLCIKIIEAKVHPALSNTFGGITAGVLRISCEILCKATICFGNWNESAIILDGVSRKVYISLDGLEEPPLGQTQLFNFYLLVVAAGGDGDRRNPRGLLLEPTGKKNGQYRRKGMFKDPKHPTNPSEFLGIFDKVDCRLRACDSVDVTLGNNGAKRYVIDIV